MYKDLKDTSIVLFHHLDLGDSIMCHGIVREYCKKYSQVVIFSYPHNYVSVSFMYKDLENITIIKGDREFARNFISNNVPSKYDESKLLGFETLNWNSDTPLEKQFHDLAGVDLSKKWDNFLIKRNLESEASVYKKASKSGDYVFLHEDPGR